MKSDPRSGQSPHVNFPDAPTCQVCLKLYNTNGRTLNTQRPSVPFFSLFLLAGSSPALPTIGISYRSPDLFSSLELFLPFHS